MKRFVDWVSCVVGPLCLLTLLILWVLWAGARQPSSHGFITRELIVLGTWALAILSSVLGIRKRPFKLKLLNLNIIVFASILGLSACFSML